MIIKCPKCGNIKVDYVDTNHQELDIEEQNGYQDRVYGCRKCKIGFSIWINFEITKVNIDYQDQWDESDIYEDECE